MKNASTSALNAILGASPRARFSLVSTTATLLLIIIGSAWLGAERMSLYNDTLDNLTPRYARLLGIQAEGSRLGTAAHSASTQLARLSYPASTPSDRAGADIQQKIRAIADAAGLRITSSQLGTVETAELFDAISLNIRIEGTLHDLEALVRGVQSLEPNVHLRSLSISAIPRRLPGARELRIDLVFGSVRLNS